MPFDPSLPAPNSKIRSGELRNQFNALKQFFDGLQTAMTQLQAQLNNLEQQVANIPAGPPGPQGEPGGPGEKGEKGDKGDTGEPGPTRITVDQNDPGGAEGNIWIRPSDGVIKVRVNGGWEERGTIKGEKGDTGDDGGSGPEGPAGLPGEVTAQQLADAISAAIAGTSANTNGVGLLDTSGFSNPDAIAVADKVNELLLSQRR